MSDNPDCTEKCRKPVTCPVCGLTKEPMGRSAPIEMASSLCCFECPGYYKDPRPPHLWPNELIGDEQEPSD